MAIITIEEPTPDQQQQIIYNKRMRGTNIVAVDPDQKFAVTLIKLAAGVNQPGDYPALKTAIEAIAGIQEISLLIDGQTPSTIPAETELRVLVEGQIRIDDLGPPEP
jgi:hypothetical protein